jgi:hypothetical protein
VSAAEEKTVPCKYCGVATRMTGTQTCDNCWEVACRVRHMPAETLCKILRGEREPQQMTELLYAMRGKGPWKWRTRDGRMLNMEDMSTEHLRNCVSLLRSKGYCSTVEFEDAWSAVASCRGDMASYYAEQQASSLLPSLVIDQMEKILATRDD